MSRVHQQRAEDAVEAARDRAKERLRALQAALAHWEEGLTQQQSAQRLDVTRQCVAKWRAFLGLSFGGRDVGASLRRG